MVLSYFAVAAVSLLIWFHTCLLSSVDAMHSFLPQRLPWIFSPGDARVKCNERADRRASTADITTDLQLGRTKVLSPLRNVLNTDRPEHHITDHPTQRITSLITQHRESHH